MQIAPQLVGLSADDYRAHVQDAVNDREIWRCLMSLDVAGFRKATAARAAHLPQPENDEEALHVMHLARSHMLHISPQGRRYSEHWLRGFAAKAKATPAVGIAVKAFKPEHAQRAADVQAEMTHAVDLAVREGVDVEHEVKEVHARMAAARQRIRRALV